MNIAVISDLHIGEGARSGDLCPGAHPGPLEADFLQKFSDFVASKSVTSDYLVVPGDIVTSATANEFQHACKVITHVRKALGVSADRVIAVPGNHDVDWSMYRKDDTTGVYWGQRYNVLMEPNFGFEAIMRDTNSSLVDGSFFRVWEFPDAIFVGYNSSFLDIPSNSVHYGQIYPEHLKALLADFDAREGLPDKLKVFCVHHHPLPHSNPIRCQPDFSQMQNSDQLITALMDRRFDFLIHGHKHAPRFQSHSIDSNFPLNVVSAGSFSKLLGSELNGLVTNQFHLIRTEDRDLSTNLVRGEMKSWAYISGDGWVESEQHNGIEHQHHFGYFAHPNDIDRSLTTAIQSLDGETIINLKKIIVLDYRFQFITSSVLDRAIDRLVNNTFTQFRKISSGREFSLVLEAAL